MNKRLLIGAVLDRLAFKVSLPKLERRGSALPDAEALGPVTTRFFCCSGICPGQSRVPLERFPEKNSVQGDWQLPMGNDARSTILRIVKKGEHDLINNTGEEREWDFRYKMGKRHSQEVSLMLKERHPNLRCLHWSKTPLSAPTVYRLDRRIYRRSITDASPGKRPEIEGGTGRDIWYSVFLNGLFPRLEEDAFDACEYRFAYMFNVPVVTRHVRFASSKRAASVIRFSTNETLIKTSKALGRTIFDRYAGYEVGDIHRNQANKPYTRTLGWHLQEGYGVVWNVTAIQDWTLVATFEKGRPL